MRGGVNIPIREQGIEIHARHPLQHSNILELIGDSAAIQIHTDNCIAAAFSQDDE
jgi:hypothetical protein